MITGQGPGALWAMLWQQVPQALSGLTALMMILFVWKQAHRVRVTRGEVHFALRDSWPMFLENVSQVVIAGSAAVVLGIVSTAAHVAFYGAAERFANAARGVMLGVVDAMMPRMTRTDEAAAGMRRFIMGGVMAVYGAAGIGLILLVPWVVPWYLGPGMEETIPVAQLLGISLLATGVGQALVLRATAGHHFTTVARISGVVAVVHVALLVPAGALWGARGAALVAIVSETLLAVLYLLDLRSSRRRDAVVPQEDALSDAAGPGAGAAWPSAREEGA